MSPLDFFKLGHRKAKKGWPYPPVSAHAPLALSQLVDLTWTIGEPRELHRAGLSWRMDRFNTPSVSTQGEFPLVTNYYQQPIASLSQRDIQQLLAKQPQGFIPNDVGSSYGPV